MVSDYVEILSLYIRKTGFLAEAHLCTVCRLKCQAAFVFDNIPKQRESIAISTKLRKKLFDVKQNYDIQV